MDKQDNSLVNKFLKQISKIIDHKLEKLTTVESAIVDQINIDGSVNLHIPPDSTIFTGVQNQSIYQNLKVGDCVKVLKQNNKASNMWIIGGHNLKRDDTVVKMNETISNMDGMVGEMNKTISNMADFIIEQGTSGIWTYRKWYSGTAECWGTNTYTLNSINTGLSGVYGYYGDISLPTSLFSETPTSISACIPWYYSEIITMSATSKDTITYRLFELSSNGQNITSFKIGCHVIGKWK